MHRILLTALICSLLAACSAPPVRRDDPLCAEHSAGKSDAVYMDCHALYHSRSGDGGTP